MTDQPAAGKAEAEDYEYDMAHEATEQPPADRRAPAQEQPSTMHVTDAGGDYGYDAAHDLA
jgi:hypothetical protein